MILGADYSSLVDAEGLREAGFQFGVARCITEVGLVDRNFQANRARAGDADLLFGAYCFLVGGQGPDMARLLHNVTDGAHDMLIQLDVERPQYHPAPKLADVAAFMDTWRSLTSHPVLIYLPPWYWRSAGMAGNAAQYGDLWLSRYLDPAPSLTPAQSAARLTPLSWDAGYGGWKKATVLQFAGTTHTSAGSVDLNAYAGTLDQLRAYTGDTMPQIIAYEVKLEDWRPKPTHGVLRSWPDRSQLPVAHIADDAILRTCGEVTTNDPHDSDWRATRDSTGRTLYALRSDYDPVVQGGDPATDAVLTSVLERQTLLTQADVDAAVAKATAALQSRISAARAALA